MVKAHSLIYAIYVCLIVSLLCGALLYIANMYNQLNIYYTTHEELYIQNQSLVNYALANTDKTSIETEDEQTVGSAYELKPYGLLTLLQAKSFIANDTVTSVHFAAAKTNDNTCVFLTNLDRPLTYSGDVKLIGDKQLPSDFINAIHIDNKPNKLENRGKITASANSMPDISESIKKSFAQLNGLKVLLKELPQNKGVYYNSFLNPTLEINLEDPSLNTSLKGNIIIRSKDSIVVKSNANLNDVILIAPKIIFEDNFKGTLQAFATRKINVGTNVELGYPSSLCLSNTTLEKSSIVIKNNSKIYGAIVLYGNATTDISKNSIDIEKEVILACDIYCTGELTLRSNVYGTVYTNKFVHKTASSGYDNCLADIEINPSKRPAHFVSMPLLSNNDSNYAAIKKVL
ncbi:hypothetical protein [Flavobacterium sp. NRK1]|uniref:hypothetical protein n=1 Tax=Flavobacterium sp. NRK1 TaxID=2954929 RepID=UPI0020922AD9|nr:hypothetical protein [Flavobacterium sp. NRK1]MCO6147923.1 hypothetical protein [Flavobacterium sp. NRK1]